MHKHMQAYNVLLMPWFSQHDRTNGEEREETDEEKERKRERERQTDRQTERWKKTRGGSRLKESREEREDARSPAGTSEQDRIVDHYVDLATIYIHRPSSGPRLHVPIYRRRRSRESRRQD